MMSIYRITKIFLSMMIVFMITACVALPADSHAYNNAPSAHNVQLLPVGVGNQNSYSGGGSSHSGGSSYSGSSHSSSGYSGSYSSGYSSYHSSGSGGGDSTGMFVFSLFIIICVIGIVVAYKVHGRTFSAQDGSSDDSTPLFIKPLVSPAAEIKKTDPNFSEDAFLAWASDIFITLNTAWTKQDWTIIRPFESESLFREHSQQLDEYIRNGTVNYLERVAVKESFIDQFYTDSQYEYIVVKMRTNMIDYVKETATGRITAGDTTTLWNMIHTLTFMRTIGTKTQEHPESVHAANCPNCGAPMNINLAGECPYCQSVVTSGEFNWVLCKFTGENI